mgnify:CR=1 FL=1
MAWWHFARNLHVVGGCHLEFYDALRHLVFIHCDMQQRLVSGFIYI